MQPKIHTAAAISSSQEQVRGIVAAADIIHIDMLHRGAREGRHRLSISIDPDEDGLTVSLIHSQHSGHRQILGTYYLAPEKRAEIDLQYHLAPKEPRP